MSNAWLPIPLIKKDAIFCSWGYDAGGGTCHSIRVNSEGLQFGSHGFLDASSFLVSCCFPSSFYLQPLGELRPEKASQTAGRYRIMSL